MSSYDEEVDKILSRAFDDIRKRINAVMSRREKNLLRDVKITSTRMCKDKDHKKDNKEKRDKKHRKSSSSRSSSSSSDN
jgi:hypothetical protein